MLYYEILRITKDKKDQYFVEDSTDEKLNVIANLLLDKRALSEARRAAEKQIKEKVEGPRFHLFEKPQDLVGILLFKEGDTTLDEANPLEVEISRINLRKLVSIWDRLMLMRPYHIVLKRRHDSDEIDITFEKEDNKEE